MSGWRRACDRSDALTSTPFLSKGKTNNCFGPCPGPASCPQPAAIDSAPCFTTTNGCDDRTSNAFRYNRTHKLFANGVSWDFAGNMFELVGARTTVGRVNVALEQRMERIWMDGVNCSIINPTVRARSKTRCPK